MVPLSEIGPLYEELRTLLRLVATRKFGVPEAEAEEIVHEAFLSLLRNHDRVQSPREYLIGAVCNGSRAYWRTTTHVQPGESNTHAVPTDTRIALDEILSRIPLRYRTLLELHHAAGYTASELATRLGTTTRYAEKLLHKAIVAARGVNKATTHPAAPRPTSEHN